MTWRLAGIAASMLFVSSACLAEGSSDACKVFLEHPIFTSSTTISNSATSESFRLFECAADFKSANDAQAAGISATIPIYDIPVPFTANWSQKNVDQWKSSHCSDEERHRSANLAYYQATYSVDPASARDAAQCFREHEETERQANDDKAIRCDLQETSTSYVFEARWRRTAGESDQPPKVISFNSVNTACQGTAFSKGDQISEGGVAVLCSMENSAAAFTLNTSRGSCFESGAPRLPKITIDSMTLDHPVQIVGQEVAFAPGTQIVTAGFPFSIQADQLDVPGDVVISSFTANKADQMEPGAYAQPIRITAKSIVGGTIKILNDGQEGGDGAVGPKGGPGDPGSPGVSRTASMQKACGRGFLGQVLCSVIPTGCGGGHPGGDGGRGKQGFPGYQGMPGGGAGEVTIDVPDDAITHIKVLTNIALDGTTRECDGRICGGSGGAGGPGGPGGDGGPGGPGAPGSTYCGGTSGGHQGPEGTQGPQGPQGPAGPNARVIM